VRSIHVLFVKIQFNLNRAESNRTAQHFLHRINSRQAIQSDLIRLTPGSYNEFESSEARSCVEVKSVGP